MKQERSCRP